MAASVLSGNRNFEARVHQNIKANFLMSPPLVVAFAARRHAWISTSAKEPLGKATDGADVFLKDIWPTARRVREAMSAALKPEVFRKLYTDFASAESEVERDPRQRRRRLRRGTTSPPTSSSRRSSTDFGMEPGNISEINGRPSARHLRRLRHHGPHQPRRRHQEGQPRRHVPPRERRGHRRTSTATARRRGNDRVMTRGTFANVRIKNLMVPGVEGRLYNQDIPASRQAKAGMPDLRCLDQVSGRAAPR